MRLYWFFCMGFALSCDFITAKNSEYCIDNTDCAAGLSCNMTLHRCDAGPTLTRVEPAVASSKGNLDIKIIGSHFIPESTVFFNELPAPVTSFSAEEIHVTLPPSPGSCGPITVKVRAPEGSQVESASLFRYKYGSIAFAPVANPPIVDTNAKSIVAARLDADTTNDLVVANSTSATLSVFRGVGDLTFMSKAATNTTVPLTGMNVADFDGDGTADLLPSNAGSFTFFQGQANLNYSQKDQYIYDNKLIQIGDFNKDRRSDLILLNNLQNNVDLYIHTSAFDFDLKPVYTLPGPASALVVDDWNGDGSADFVVTDDTHAQVLLFLGHGDGTFAEPLGLPTGAGPSLLAAADLDGDGKRDLVIVTTGGSASLIAAFGAGDGTFVMTTLPIAANPRQLALGDLDCDGLPEAILYHQGTTQLSVYGNRGSARDFDAAVPFAAGAVVGSFALAPLDTDDKPDLALLTSTTPANLVLLRNTAN